MAITPPPTIADAPEAPDRAQRSTFSPRVTLLASYIKNVLVQAMTAMTQWMYSVATQTEANAIASQAGAASANYKGLWSTLVGALNIPASTSHSGKLWLLTGNVANVAAHTPGVSASWQEIGRALTPSSSLTQAIANDLVLTNASAQALRINCIEIGRSVRLPDATTLNLGTQYVLSNTGAQPLGLRNTGVVLIGVVQGFGTATVVLVDNSTSAGTWLVSGNLLPALVTVDHTFSSTFAVRPINAYAQMDEHLSVHFVPLAAGGFAAVAINSAARQLGTPFTVDSNPLATMDYPVHAAFKTVGYRLIVFWTTTSASCCRVLEVSGVTLTAGTTQTTSSRFFPATPQAENSIGPPCIVPLTALLYYLAGMDANTTLCSTAVAVDNLTPTIGARVNTATGNLCYQPVAYRWDDATALVHYKGGSDPYPNYARAIGVGGAGGVVCTAGAETAITGVSGTTSATPASCQLASGKVLIADNNYTTVCNASVLTVSGLSTSAGAAFTVESGLSSAPAVRFGAINQTRIESRFARGMTALSSTTAVLNYRVGNDSRSVVLLESANTLSAPGGILREALSLNAVSGLGSHGPIGSTEMLSFHDGVRAAGVSAYSQIAVPYQIIGTTISTGLAHCMTETPVAESVVYDCGVKIGSNYLYTRDNALRAYVPLSVYKSDGNRVVHRGEIDLPVSSMDGINSNYNAVGWGKPNLGNGTLIFTNTAGQVGTAQLMRMTRIEVVA